MGELSTMIKHLKTPIPKEEIESLSPGDFVSISGWIYAGRDAVLPRIVELAACGGIEEAGIDLDGSVIFHTAVSPAGVGPTSSNKLEIEASIAPLSKAGVRVHLGKGKLAQATVESLKDNASCFAIIPPVSALLEDRTLERRLVAFPELGMEAFYALRVEDFPAVIAEPSKLEGNRI